jgi:hypothetical protein
VQLFLPGDLQMLSVVWSIAVDSLRNDAAKGEVKRNATMVPILTEKDFSPHLNSKFYVQFADGSLELVLAEVQRTPLARLTKAAWSASRSSSTAGSLSAAKSLSSQT